MGSYVAKANFHWISLVEAMMSKYKQPTKKSCRKKVSMNTLPGNHACISGFSAWVHSKTFFTRFLRKKQEVVNFFDNFDEADDTLLDAVAGDE